MQLRKSFPSREEVFFLDSTLDVPFKIHDVEVECSHLCLVYVVRGWVHPYTVYTFDNNAVGANLGDGCRGFTEASTL